MNNRDNSTKFQFLKDKTLGFVKNNKKKSIAIALSFALGGMLGNSANISQEEYDANLNSINSTIQEINASQENYNFLCADIDELTSKKEELSKDNSTLKADIDLLITQINNEEKRIAAEKAAKEETER